MIRRKPATLADRHARASLRANVAIVTFTDTADALDEAAAELDSIAAAARAEGDGLHIQAGSAGIEAQASRYRAAKIRELIGATE